MTEQATLEQTPIVFVGQEQQKLHPVVARIFVRCDISTSERGSFRKLTALDEIPLLRKLYAQYGGSIKVVSGLEHPVFERYTIQELNDYEFRNVIAQLKRTFNGVMVLKRAFNFFDEVYGTGESCQYVAKVKALAEEWNGQLEADNVDRLLQKHFPHVATRSVDDILSVPGLDTLGERPQVGIRAARAAASIQATPPMPAALPAVGEVSVPQTEAEINRLGATILTGAPTPDEALVDFLVDPKRTEDNPFSKDQAWAIATLLTKKQTADWDVRDYAEMPGLSRRNHPRIVRLVDSYMQLQRQEGVPADDREDESQDSILD